MARNLSSFRCNFSALRGLVVCKLRISSIHAVSASSAVLCSQMDNLLLDLALLTVGAHGLVVGAVLLSVPLDVHRSYVDADLRS